MKKVLLIVAALALPVLALPGCALTHTQSDDGALLYSHVWETPGLEQHTVALKFAVEGGVRDEQQARRDAADILWDSAKFRIVPEGKGKADYLVDMTMLVRRETHKLKTGLGVLILYAWPVDAQDYFCEVFVDIRRPSGELVAHSYAKSQGKATLWLGYVLWPKWAWNGEQAAIIRRDALKAAVFQMSRSLMPEKEKE
jgi:hypothetical protein